VDFSFQTGFRERASFSSLLQVMGRVSRNAEYPDAIVWDFQHASDNLLNLHPHLKTAAKVVGILLEKYKDRLSPEHCTEALQMELNLGTGDMEETAENIYTAESHCDFPKVAKLCRLITADTQTVVVSQDLIRRLQSRDRTQFPSSHELMMHSVQVWKNKLKEMPVTAPLGFGGDLVGVQEGTYDAFLGYMKGLLPVLGFKKNGGNF
jgi:CRISPR-associated endonuclease/helicase Cas3